MEQSTLTEVNKQIYAKFGDRVIGEEFISYQNEFYAANCKLFKAGEEENSLESHNVYKDYMSTMEKLLDHNMTQKEGFTEEQLDAFYTNLKQNMKEYERINSHTLDILYGVIDFEQFK